MIVALYFGNAGMAVMAQSYQQSMQQWYLQREKSLKAENGWLNLVGLHWLEEGMNSFGSDSSMNIVFPPKMAARAGSFERRGEKVWLHSTVPVRIGDREVTDSLVFHPDSTTSPFMQFADLKWNIIRRENKLGIRLRDLKSKAVTEFPGLERFPLDRRFLVEARYEPNLVPTTVPITNVLGQTTKQFSPGMVHFNLEGRAYSMIALVEEGELFFVFGDPTNGVETYAAGRFLKAEMPPAAGTVILDFNKAYNPPCVFTPFATCPLPPARNMLDLRITAGEKNFVGHH